MGTFSRFCRFLLSATFAAGGLATARESLPQYVDVRIPITENWHAALTTTAHRRALAMADIFAHFGVKRHEKSTLSLDASGEILVGRLDLTAAINLMGNIVAEIDTPAGELTRKLDQHYLRQFDPDDPFARPLSEIVDRSADGGGAAGENKPDKSR